MAGYSGTPLAKKLGIADGMRLWLVGEPEGFRSRLDLGSLGTILVDVDRGEAPYDLILLFCPDRAALATHLFPAVARLRSGGGLWLGWPKKSSGVVTDVSEADVRAEGLHAGLVDNKVCAITEVWSGLRFVVRVADRTGWPHQ